MNWPVYRNHDEVFCFRCSTHLTGDLGSAGFPVGAGKWGRDCPKCGYRTWYDIEPELWEELERDATEDATPNHPIIVSRVLPSNVRFKPGSNDICDHERNDEREEGHGRSRDAH